VGRYDQAMNGVRSRYGLLCLCLLCLGAAQRGSAEADAQRAVTQYSIAQWGHRDGLPSTAIYALAQTPDGYLWLGTSDGLVRFDGLHFVQVPLSVGDMAFGRVRALLVGRAGNLWIGTADGSLVRMEGGTMKLASVGMPIVAIRQDAASAIAVETTGGTFCFDPSTLTQEAAPARSAGTGECTSEGPPSLPAVLFRSAQLAAQVRKTITDSDGNLWIATRERGVLRIAHPNGAPVVERITKASGLSSDSVWDVLQDSEKNLWIATDNGLDRLRKGKFNTLTQKDGLLNNEVDALVATKSGIFTGSAFGLNRITAKHAEVVFRGGVLAIAGARDGALLMATPKGIVSWKDGRAQSLKLGRDADHVTAMAQDAAGTLWFYDQQKGLFRWRPGSPVLPVALPGHPAEVVRIIQSDDTGKTWFGLTSGAVLLYDRGDFHAYSRKDGLAGGTLHSISVIADGGAWIASERGLSRYADRHFTSWSRANGLPGNRVLWAVPGPKGRLWLGYDVGIASVRVGDLRRAATDARYRVPFDFYDEGDGLNGNPDLRSSSPAVLAADARLWLTTAEGVASLDLRHIPRDLVPPPVHVLSFRADDVDIDPAAAVKLPSRTHRIEINYTGLSFTDPGRVTFRYRLLGFDPQWHNVKTHRFATYTNLPPGHYRFEVMAANQDGVWSNNIATLTFSIAPAIYQTAWFLVLCGVAAMLAAMALLRLRVRTTANRLRQRFEERLAERARVAQDLHDNLLQEVMGISLQLEIADELTPADSPGKPILRRALDLSAATLATGRGVLTTLRTKTLLVQDLMREAALAAQAFPEERRRMLIMSADESEWLVRASVGEEVIQIAREALRNALQHTDGKVSVRFRTLPGELRVIVEDEGAGIDAAILSAGVPGHFGLLGMRERADRIAATLRFRPNPERGMRVELVVPAHIAFEQPPPLRSRWSSFMARWREPQDLASRHHE
jgi:ligand-binding sensor domain-containing protein/signal transduction histidine kinase